MFCDQRQCKYYNRFHSIARCFRLIVSVFLISFPISSPTLFQVFFYSLVHRFAILPPEDSLKQILWCRICWRFKCSLRISDWLSKFPSNSPFQGNSQCAPRLENNHLLQRIGCRHCHMIFLPDFVLSSQYTDRQCFCFSYTPHEYCDIFEFLPHSRKIMLSNTRINVRFRYPW